TLGVALAGWGAVTAAQYAFDRWQAPPPPIAQQLNDVVREAARNGLRVAESYRADLHGSGERSRILVLRPTARATRPIPNELRIYDVSDGRLRLRFRFVPRTAGVPPSVHLADVADFDGNGSMEILVSLEIEYVEHTTEVPALVAWDPRGDAYGIAPLLTPDGPKLGDRTKPRIRPRGRPGLFTTPRELYVVPLRIRD